MPPANPLEPESNCPCGSQTRFSHCCQPYIEGRIAAPTAEALMRSRYTAHVALAIDYLWQTWSPEKRIRSSKADIEAWASSCEWLGLQILATEAGSAKDNEGVVSFIALFRQNGQLHHHQETSLFKKTLEGWQYLDHQ
ncbi:MAG: YchJ family metal-binding protein [Cellvibrio sp.]